MEQLWQRVSEGQHTALLDIAPGEPPAQLGLRVLRVRCDVPEATLGPLREVRAKIERLVGGAPPPLDPARSRVVSGLRRRLLGDVLHRTPDAELIDAANRLAQLTDRRWAIVFDAVDAADPATLDVLRRLVARPGALRVALVLAFRQPSPSGPAGDLLAAVRASLGAEAILRPPDGAAPLAGAASSPAPRVVWRELPGDVLRVLRAGALVGPAFEGDVVAALLRADPLDVLEALQRAADAGVPLEDRGDGRFHLPQEAVEALRSTLLPSLARTWHRRLAELLCEEDPEATAEAPHDLREPRAAAALSGSDADEEGPEKIAEPGLPVLRNGPATQAPETLRPPAAPPAAARAQASVAPASRAQVSISPAGGALASVSPAGGSLASASPAGGVVASTSRDGGAHPGSAIEVGPLASASRLSLRSGRDTPTPVAPAVPGPPPWPYTELFGQGPDSLASEPPESVLFDGPPDSLDAPIPGPIRVPRDLAPPSAAPPPDDPGSVASFRSARGSVLRAPGSASDRAASAPHSAASWSSAPDAASAARFGDLATRAAADSIRAAAPSGMSLRPSTQPDRAAPALHPDRAAPAPQPDRAAPAPQPDRAATQPTSARRLEEARAATHFLEAGEIDEAARRYRAAAAQAAAAGAYAQAIGYAQKALALLDGLPATDARRRLRIRALAVMGRVQWQAAGPDPAFTLAGALEVLDAARALLAQRDPPELHAELAVLIASVCYDLGDARSLDRALDELTTASRLLLDASDPIGAARLLNDQAAVHVRMGDPVRATHLLTESRRIFEERAKVDPVARVELAETDHLFARIPLHVPARPGRESDALSMGIDHALAAERIYKQLGDSRELARVWETLGRLELRKGRLDRAAQRLTAALEVEQALGDVLGLARATAALAEVLAAKGQRREALMMLAESVTLNLEKGSPLGLAYNRRALDVLVPDLALQGEEAELLRNVAAQLAAAESVLGRLKLPGEPD